MSDISTVSQYYNLYDSTKEYTELLFRAGKVLQSKELNEMQSILKEQIKNVGDTILTDGDVIEGCQLVIDGTSVTLTSGRIYLNGNVRKIPNTQLTITGVGTEIIGVKLKSEAITPDDDSDLLDVASGFDNYNQDGAYRRKETVEVTINDSSASILYTLVDGQQLTVNNSEDLTQLDKINATLARRTFDESGNYKVSGLKLVDKNYYDPQNVYISLEPGKAYVKGYEVNKVSAQTIALKRADTLRQVDNEPKIFRTASIQYALNNDYANAINKIVSIVQTTQNLTRGAIVGGIDYLPLSPVTEIISVTQGDTTFTAGVDYQLLNDGVDWSLGGNAPDPGSSYTVVWSYNKTMIQGVDYTLNTPEGSDVGYVEFLTEGDKPIDGSTFLVDYNFKLCRRDIIALDKNGKIVITSGQPDILRTVESPSVSSDDVLVLGSVLLRPNSNKVIIINNNTQTIPMLDLYKMLERINALEYNQSISDLDKEAADGESATELMGVFTDGFIGTSKADVYHSAWDASIDLDNQELTMPYETSLAPLVVNKAQDYSAHMFSRLLTAPYTEITLLSQPLATTNLRINSYNAFPKTPTVRLSPEEDNWVEETEVVIQGDTKTSATTLRRWWYHKNASWAQEEKALWESYGFTDGGESLGWNSTQATVNKSVTTDILDTTIMYMRQKSVSVTIQNLEPLQDNIAATFDGVAIDLSPTQVSYKGTISGTLKADVNGKAEGQFMIPANTLCGTREVRVYPVSNPSLVGSANYTANGRLLTTNKTVWTETVKLNASDPLAQSFQFEQDQYLTGVGLFFLEKDKNEPIIVQVRNMVNGYPGTTVYAEQTLNPSEIGSSSDASNETRVMFNDPVYCQSGEQYCFTILSNSSLDAVWIAETTKLDIATQTQVAKNPYLNGLLFSSSNALTWTAHQSSDLKFNLYGAKFEATGHTIFQEVSNVTLDRLMVVSKEFTPSGCSINWQYSINGGEWLPIEAYDDRELSEIAQNVKIRVNFTTNLTTSPVIALDSLLLAGFKNKSTSVYVSKNVAVAEGFNNVKQIIDLNLPVNTNVNMYYATDINGTTWTPLTNTSTVQKSNKYKTYTFEHSLDDVAHNYRCKVELTSVVQTSRPKAQNLRSIMKTI